MWKEIILINFHVISRYYHHVGSEGGGDNIRYYGQCAGRDMNTEHPDNKVNHFSISVYNVI